MENSHFSVVLTNLALLRSFSEQVLKKKETHIFTEQKVKQEHCWLSIYTRDAETKR